VSKIFITKALDKERMATAGRRRRRARRARSLWDVLHRVGREVRSAAGTRTTTSEGGRSIMGGRPADRPPASRSRLQVDPWAEHDQQRLRRDWARRNGTHPVSDMDEVALVAGDPQAGPHLPDGDQADATGPGRWTGDDDLDSDLGSHVGNHVRGNDYVKNDVGPERSPGSPVGGSSGGAA
jgi:hypothetical protein